VLLRFDEEGLKARNPVELEVGLRGMKEIEEMPPGARKGPLPRAGVGDILSASKLDNEAL
jgi:hypothetical protein